MLNSRVAYKVYPGVFTPDECVKVEEAARKTRKLTGRVAEDGVDAPEIVNKGLRESDIYFFAEQWVAQRIQEIVMRANKEAGWNLHVSDLEPFQFGEYGRGGYYDWHLDTFGEPYTDKGHLTGKVRKLSMSVLMNDPADFDGGEFEVSVGYRDNKPIEEVVGLKKTGDVVVFPSVLAHRVRPVTRGTRKSLVCWIAGPPFT